MYLFFDTETTGLPKVHGAPLTKLNNWPRMVQLAWLLYDKNQNLISEADYIIKPRDLPFPPMLPMCMALQLRRHWNQEYI